MRYWISVEGIIGAGKSTILPLLADKLEQRYELPVVVVQEPVEQWQEDGILQRMYDNKEEWNYIGQTHFFHTRTMGILEAVKNTPENCIILTERSLEGDRIMWETQLETERVSVEKHKYYLQLWIMWHKLLHPLQQNAIIYLRPGLKQCIHRMKKRGRIEEEKIDTVYLKAMQKVHDETLLKLSNCITLRGDEKPSENLEIEWDRIEAFLKKIIKK